MTTNSEQLRTDFEVWWKDRQVAVSIKEDAFSAYQAGRAALLTERDALREALEVMVEMVEMNGFGRAYAMNVARAALAQKQEEV